MRDVPRALAGPASGLLGAVALLLVGALARPQLSAPTVPEVLAEWSTFFVPPALFTQIVNTFGGQAKVALFWTMNGLVLLAGLLAGAVYARWPSARTAVAAALVGWLLCELVVLPGAGYGFFGTDLYPAGPLAVTAAFLAGWAALALVLSLGYWLLRPSDRRRRASARTAAGSPAARKEAS